MPEGDTIHKLAAALCPELCGSTVRSLDLQRLDARRLTGGTATQVSSRGKHLFIHFDNGLVLRSHLGMYGSWHRYGLVEKWRKPVWQASIVLKTDRRVFVCFNAKEVEILAAGGYRLQDEVHRLGPDLIRDHLDAGVLVDRARELLPGDALLVDVLLDQRIAAGIGNVYKSEILFLEGQAPLAQLTDIRPGALGALYRTAADLLRRNVQGGRRVTRWIADGRGDLWVYGRAGLPCLRCGHQLQRAHLGMRRRVTYWCPCCQGRS